ncbi:MAG: OsmC family protein [Pirellula sp.]
MNSEQLKATQAPIKERYKLDPNSAIVTMQTHGTVDLANQHCWIDSYAGRIRAGLHPAAGGTEADACSAELLLESLVACAGVTFSAVATNMGIPVRSCRIEAQGDMDFKGTLGVDRTAPVGLTAVRLLFQIDSEASQETIDKLISLTERYCVIYQTLSKGVNAMSTCVESTQQRV